MHKLEALRQLANARKQKCERKTGDEVGSIAETSSRIRHSNASKLKALRQLANARKRKCERKTGDEVGSIAGRKLQNSKTPKDVKSLAGSALSQRAPQL